VTVFICGYKRRTEYKPDVAVLAPYSWGRPKSAIFLTLDETDAGQLVIWNDVLLVLHP